MFLLLEARTRRFEKKCQCGVGLRPNQDTMDRIRINFAALKTSHFRTTQISSRGKKSGHHPWQTDPAKATDARRGATKNSRKFTSILGRWQNNEIYPASQLVHGWTEEYVKYLDYISKIDISYDAPYNQRIRHEKSLFIKGVHSNKQAGPQCQRPDNKSSANALVNIQREQGKGVRHIPMNLRTRQRDTLDPAVQQHLVEEVFLVIFILNMDRKPNLVCSFARGWTAWPSGRSDPKHSVVMVNLLAQHTMEQPVILLMA